MHNPHTKNTVRYYLLAVIVLAFLFFSNDFGLTDVQKTAIVMAVGIDREEENFILTSQIAIPQASTQGKASEAVQLVSRGKTIAEAFEQINAKTGWYPKLVFCKLILLGEKTCEQDVFDALDFFLRDEYLTDDCLVAACDGLATEILNTSALVDPSSSVAIGKVLSNHAERVGSVLPATLRDFSIGYFGDSKSSFLPLIKIEPQQEKVGQNENTGGSNGENTSSGGNTQSSQNSGSGSSAEGEKKEDKPVFSARETALFVAGKRVGTLTAEETFAFSSVKNSLQLASYSVETENNFCTLTIKQNDRKLKLQVGKEGRANLTVDLTLTAGVSDYAASLPLEKITDVGDVPSGVFTVAAKRLEGEIKTVFEKSRACGCDLFGLRERLIKHESRRLHKYASNLLDQTTAIVNVHFRNVR